MTSELTSEAPRDAVSAPVDSGDGRGDAAAGLHLRLALAFLAISSALLAIAAARLVFPDLLSEVAILSYGRLLPAAVDLLIFGWLTFGLIAAGYYILPRMSGTPLRRQGLAVFAGGVLTVAVVAGTVAVLLGGNEGRQYLEYPIWADAAIVFGLLLVARVVTGHIADNRAGGLTPPDWYFGAAIVWLLLAHITGSIPGLRGTNVAIQTGFYRGALLGLWLASAALGVAYYVASRIVGRDPRTISQLAVYAFWSTGFVFSMATVARQTYTIVPDWLETIGTVFAIGLLVPIAVIAVDLVTMLRTQTDGTGAAAYLLFGATGLAVFAVVNIGLGLRSANAIIGLTDWAKGLDLLALLGVFTFWLLAFVRHEDGRPAGRGHLAVSVVSVLAVVGALLVSGLQTGLAAVAAANDGEPFVGDAFRVVSEGRDGHTWVVFVGLALFALAQIWLALTFRAGSAGAEDGPAPDAGADVEMRSGADEGGGRDAGDDVGNGEDDAGDELGGLPAGIPVSLGKVRAGALGLFSVVALFLFVFPILEAEHRDATLLAESVRDYSAFPRETEGRDIYLAEGCWYCHTQQVRAIVTDVGLGPVAQPGDYALEQPDVSGIARLGPDLMFVGSRLDRDAIAGLLGDPRAERSWAAMPAHDYLSSGDLRALAAYVASLTDE